MANERRMDLVFWGEPDPWNAGTKLDACFTDLLSKNEIFVILGNVRKPRWSIYEASCYLAGHAVSEFEGDGYGYREIDSKIDPPIVQEIRTLIEKYLVVDRVSKGAASVEFMGFKTLGRLKRNQQATTFDSDATLDFSELTFPILSYYRCAKEYLFPNAELGLDVPVFFMFHNRSNEDLILTVEGYVVDSFESLDFDEMVSLVSSIRTIDLHGICLDETGVICRDKGCSFVDLMGFVGSNFSFDVNVDIAMHDEGSSSDVGEGRNESEIVDEISVDFVKSLIDKNSSQYRPRLLAALLLAKQLPEARVLAVNPSNPQSVRKKEELIIKKVLNELRILRNGEVTNQDIKAIQRILNPEKSLRDGRPSQS